MSTYKLYATKTGEIPEGVEFSLRPCNTNYLLVFTDKELGKPFVEIPPDTDLSEEEQQFVLKKKKIVIGRALKENKSEYLGFLDSLNDSLESSINTEKKKKKPQKAEEDKT